MIGFGTVVAMTRTRKTTITALVALAVLVAAVVTLLVRRDPPRQDAGADPSAVTASAPASAGAGSDGWVGSWAVAVQNGGRSFQQQTVRQVLRTSIGGDTVRIRLSNEFGSDPLTVSNVRLARHVRTGTIDPATNVAVTFGAGASVTIAPGGTAQSDPITFALPAGGDVAISAYLPQGSGATTQHRFANRDNYVAWNDQTSAATLTDPENADSYFFLSGLDVRDAAAEGAVVALGASITDGSASTFGANRRWPDQLSRRLNEAGRTIGVLNAGISGNQLTRDGAGESALKRFDRDVLAQPGVRWVVFSDAAINDLGDDDPPSGQELIDALKQLIQRSHDAGVKIFCATLTPYEGTGYWSAEGEQGRDAVNAFVRGEGSGCDAVIDLDTATHDPEAPTRYLGDYDSGDHLHPNDAGMQAIAEAVDLNLFG